MSTRRHRVLFAFLVAAIPTIAVASTPPSGPTSPPQSAPSAAPSDLEAARAAYVKALEYYEKGEYALARQKFEEAAAIADRPQIHFNIARCHEKLGKLVAARDEYRYTEAAAKNAGSASLEKQSAEAANSIEPKLAHYTLTVTNAGATATLDGVVRREEAGQGAAQAETSTTSRCASLTGESPVPVSAGAPGSRTQSSGRDPDDQAGRQKSVRQRELRSGEQQRGPQHEVKPAASTEKQSASRAAHVTAKATSESRAPECVDDRGGVRGAARVEGEARNTGGPSASPKSGQGASYKPKAKSTAVQRESEGVTVPKSAASAARTKAVKNNAVGGKDPCSGHVDDAGKREGMAASSGPNDPDGRRPIDKVRRLQRRLCGAAKRHRERRFHALYCHIARRDVLAEAWTRVRKNKGAAGVDKQTLVEIEQRGVALFLEELGVALRDGTYRPQVVLRRYIPKADGRKRPLGIPTIRDRVAQMATKLVLEPIFEADFLPCSYGFRPRRSAMMALETLRKLGAKGGHHVFDADIRDYFGSIDHDKLMKLVERRISDPRVLKLLRHWLEAGVMENGVVSRIVAGTPQGGVISPLLSNIYLHVLDTLWMRHSAPLGELVRYADDFVVMCKTKRACEQAEQRIKVILMRLGLELHPDKTRRVELYDGKEGFDFLGCHLHKRMSGRIWEKQRRAVYFLQRWPSPRAMKRVKQRVKELTPRGRCHADLRDVIDDINPVIRGWGNYFKTGNAAKRFNQLDSYVWRRLVGLRVKRKGRDLRPNETRKWTREAFENLGLHRLRGTVQYPETA